MELSKSVIHKWLSDAITGLRPAGAIDRGEQDSHFLPNFCAGSMVLNVALIAEMSAFVFTLNSPHFHQYPGRFADYLYFRAMDCVG